MKNTFKQIHKNFGGEDLIATVLITKKQISIINVQQKKYTSVVEQDSDSGDGTDPREKDKFGKDNKSYMG